MNDTRSVLEGHLQSIALAVLVGFAGWNVTVVNELGHDIVTLQLNVAVLQTKVESLKEQLDIAASDRFTGTDWRIEKAEITRRLQELEKWMLNVRQEAQQLRDGRR